MDSQRLVAVRGEPNRMAIEILKIENLTKRFDGIKALDNVSLTAIEDTITLIIGPNGSGKTTLINTVSGFYRPDEGKITFENNDITHLPPHEICKLGIVRTFQIPKPLKRLTVLENLLIADENSGENITQSLSSSWEERESELVKKAYHHLEFLRMKHLWNTESQELSGGQLKLLEIGRALMRNAKLIIMDEPIGGINPALAHLILEKLVALKKMGISLILVEHRLDIILKYVDYIHVMAGGRLIAQGTEEDILQNPEVVDVYLSAARQET